MQLAFDGRLVPTGSKVLANETTHMIALVFHFPIGKLVVELEANQSVEGLIAQLRAAYSKAKVGIIQATPADMPDGNHRGPS